MESLKKTDPKTIGPFETVARLGAGGMGVVYLAQRKSERVALKVISSARKKASDHGEPMQRMSKRFSNQTCNVPNLRFNRNRRGLFKST